MNYEVYRMYCQDRKLIEKAKTAAKDLTKSELSLIADMKMGHAILEATEPDYVRRYNMEKEMFKSFTPEQRDFICNQIGWWYIMWKDKMWVEDKPNQHWLGRGKEELKTMICGE